MSAVDRSLPARCIAVVMAVGVLLSTMALSATAQADQPTPTDGIEMAQIGDREYPRLKLLDGTLWYLAPSCPWPGNEVPSGSACGGEQVILRDDTDLRCTYVITRREGFNPERATWRFCLTRPPLSPGYHWTDTQNQARIEQLRNAVGACVGTTNGCMPMEWWPRASDGTIDCAAIPQDRLGDSLAKAAANDPALVHRTCAILNAYMSGTDLPAGTTAADLNLAGRTVADGVPIGTSTARTDKVVDWSKVGDSLASLCSTPVNIATMGVLCVGKSAIEVTTNLWGSMDCAIEFDKCLAEAAARAMITGLELTLGSLRTPTGVDLTDPGLRSVLGALGTVSAYLLLTFLLVNALVAAVRMRTRELVEGGLGVIQWAFGLGVGITFVAAAIYISDAVADWFAGETAGTAEVVYARFFSLMYSLAQSGQLFPLSPVNGWLLALFVFLLGAFCSGIAYLLLVFRKGAIVLAVALLVLQLAGSAGPPSTRKWKSKGLSVLWACIIAKPLSVIAFRLGESWIGQARGMSELLIGVATLGIAAVAPFIVVKWFPLAGTEHSGSSRGSLAIMAATALTMVATRRSLSDGTIRANAPATGHTLSQGNSTGLVEHHVPSAGGAKQAVRSAATGTAIVAAVGAVGAQMAMDGVNSGGGATESPYPDQLPYLMPPPRGGTPPHPRNDIPPSGPIGPAAGGGRW